jgi:hypothetical protein
MVLTHSAGKYEFHSAMFFAERATSAARSGTGIALYREEDADASGNRVPGAVQQRALLLSRLSKKRKNYTNRRAVCPLVHPKLNNFTS